MPSSRSKKEISSHLFKKYTSIREAHLNKTDDSVALNRIKKDCEVVASYQDIHIKLMTKCDIHHTSLYKLLNVFRHDDRLCYSRILEDPYEFVRVPDNVFTYEKAESIAEKFSLKGIDETSKIRAWVYDHIMFKKNQIYVDRPTLLRAFLNHFDSEAIEKLDGVLMKLPALSGKVTLPELYHIEVSISDTIMELYQNSCRTCSSVKPIPQISETITNYENEENITLTKKQRKAVDIALQFDFSVIYGLPGTGKSTIADCICKHYEDDTICLTAPTGMAVNNLRKKCKSAKKAVVGTMHKLLFDTFVQEDFESRPKIMIIDEFSMTDNVLFYRLLQWCRTFKNKLVLLADNQQLPPIGAGEPLEAILSSGLFHTIHLKTIQRQKEGALKQVVLKLHNPELSLIKKQDIDKQSVFFFNFSTKNIRKLIHKYELTYSNCQFVSPQHKHAEGTVEMNTLLQSVYFQDAPRKRFVPPLGMKAGNVFYEHDRVVRTINHYSDSGMFANGDVGTITYNSAEKSVNVTYAHSGQVQTVSIVDLYEEFALSYCLTVHKVQGSEYENVVLLINDSHSFSWSTNNAKKLLYTAMSRAKSRCFIMGNPELLELAQKSACHPQLTLLLKSFSDYDVVCG